MGRIGIGGRQWWYNIYSVCRFLTLISFSHECSTNDCSLESERGSYQDLYKNLFAAIRENAPLAIDWKEAELTMLITELAIRSAKEGRTVDVPMEECTGAERIPTAVDSTEVSEDETVTASGSTTSVSTAPARSPKLVTSKCGSAPRGFNWLVRRFKRIWTWRYTGRDLQLGMNRIMCTISLLLRF